VSDSVKLNVTREQILDALGKHVHSSPQIPMDVFLTALRSYKKDREHASVDVSSAMEFFENHHEDDGDDEFHLGFLVAEVIEIALEHERMIMRGYLEDLWIGIKATADDLDK
jgi:hypothetical protein